MQKEKFQEYLYNREIYKIAELKELKELIQEYPWFSSAGIILLLCSKAQSDPDFNSLLKSQSIHIPNRKLLQKMLQSSVVPLKAQSKTPQENTEDSGFHNRIPGLLDSQESVTPGDEIPGGSSNFSVLEDDSLLDFAYISGRTESPEETRGKSPETESKALETEEKNFDHWISKLGSSSVTEKSPYKKHEIIESFIHSDVGVIRADKETQLLGDIAKSSAEEHEGFITDTLARIYLKQGLYHKAIYAYEKLCLKYPEKSIYFATQIEEIKSLYIKK